MISKSIFIFLCILLSNSAFSKTNKNDLELKNGLYLRNFYKITCSSYTDDAVEPSYELKKLNVKIGELLVDRQLNNALIRLKFSSAGSVCSYSAILKRDRETVTLKLSNSKVFAIEGNDSSCFEQKNFFDELFKIAGYEASPGRHEFVALIIRSSDSYSMCPNSSNVFRLVFDKNRERDFNNQ